MAINQRDVTIVIGQTGSGKSFWSNEYLKTKPRVLVATAGFKDFDVTYVESYEGLISYLEQHDAFGTFKPFRVGYHFRPEEENLYFETLLALKNTLGVAEEAERFHPMFLPAYQEVIYRGRHDGIELLCVSLAPKDMPTAVRRQCTRMICFRQIMPTDIDWISEVVGDAALKLPELSGPPSKPPHPYLLWTPLGGARIIPAGKFVTGP